MKKLIVTGASGFLGWNICRTAKSEWDVYGTVCSHPVNIDGVNVIRVDLTDYISLKKMFSDVTPDAVIHTAAMANPNHCQSHKEASYRINVEASLNIAGLCADMQIPCVFTSTDLVFNGLRPPYREDDPVCPVNIYGEHKAMAEEGMLKRYPDTAVCRMALMFGQPSPASESFVQPLTRGIREGKEVTLFTDEFRTPLSAEAAAQGLFIALEKVNGRLHLGGADRISRYDLGRLLADVMGCHDSNLIPCKQKDVPMAAPRSPDLTFDISKAKALGFNPLPIREEFRKFVEFGSL